MFPDPRFAARDVRWIPLLLASFSLACTGGVGGDSGEDISAVSAPVTVSFQNGVSPTSSYAGSSDTTLEQASPSTAFGSNVLLDTDHDYPDNSGNNSEAVFAWDVSAIPAGSTVTSATLTFNVNNPCTGNYSVYALTRAWTEAGATWNSASSGAAWATAGARGTTDRGSTVLATLGTTQTGKSSVALNAAGIAAVQGWVNNPSSNHGLIADTTNNYDGLGLDSREVGTASNRPQLTVVYTPPASSSSQGLAAQYFSDQTLSTLVLSRTDATVNFDWGTGSPAASVPADHFSARWTGTVTPLYSETYTFTTTSDDGVRLWVNGTELVNNWTDHAATSNSGTLALTAGKAYSLKLEFYENGGNAVSKLAWSSAHQAAQIIPASQLAPGAVTPPPSTDAGTPPPSTDAGTLPPSSGLDPSGTRIPDTNYAIPSGAIFMSPTGNDSNAGTQSAPVATLTRAVALVPANGTVVMRDGVYRQGSTASIYKVFTLQNYPHEQPWFDGTDVVTGWTADGAGHYYVSWNTPDFCSGHYYDSSYLVQTQNGPCAYYDQFGDTSNPASPDPQMVFEDGTYIHEVTTLAGATGQNFFYDQNAKRLYLGFNPSGHTVELAKRPMAFVLQGGAGGQVIRGIGFRRFASQQYNRTLGHGAVLSGTAHITWENDVFTQQAGAGLAFSVSTGSIVRSSVFAKNGANGLDANGSASSGATDGLVIEGNIFNGNNTERFGLGCGYSCDAAGSKIAHMVGFTVKNNVFENGVGVAKGFWCDEDCSNGVIVNNLVVDNGDTGIFYEISNTGIIASNLVVGNGGYGIKAGSANTKIYNNTLVNNGTNALIYDDNRTQTAGEVGPETVNVDFSNNILSGGKMVSAWRTSSASPNTGPNTFFSGLDYNAYFRPNASPTTLWDWREGSSTEYASCAALHSGHGWESHCADITSGSDPFFVNAAGFDYRVRTNSVAYQSGKALPSDVAAALGLSSGGAVSRGAITWPAKP